MQPMVLDDSLLQTDAWQSRLDVLAAQHYVPGAQVGILMLNSDQSPDIRVLSTGLTSLSTRVEVTPDTLFQYGSISKVWTTTLVMQLIDEGRLTLDTRVQDVLPDFTLADSEAAAKITIRHLLNHTSGIDGDVFTDTGDGDDCVEIYVRQLASTASVTEPGGPLSYCNAGFVIAGRIVEVLRHRTWDDAVTDYLLRPLGLRHVITRAQDAPLFRTAVGHLKTDPSRPDVVPTTRWMLPRAIGPAGLITGSAETLLQFGAAHLRDGLGLTGQRILSADSARRMRQAEVDLTAMSTTQPAWGLGWHWQTWGDETAFAHGGDTIGQSANLQIFPELGLAIVVLTNSGGAGGFIKDIHHLLGSELGLTAPQPRLDPVANEVDLSHLLGIYESTTLRWELRQDAHSVLLVSSTKEAVTGEPDPNPRVVVPAGPNRFLVAQDGQELEIAGVRHAGVQYLYFGRLLKRTSLAPSS